MQQQQPQEVLTWKDRLKDSSWVTIAWDWFQNFLGRVAESVLWCTMIYSCYGLIPGAPQAPASVSSFVFVAQFVALDVGGMGLGKLAQEQGLDRWSYTRVISYILIAITLITLTYAGVEHAVAIPQTVTGWVEAVLVIARSVMTILYAQAIHAMKVDKQQTRDLVEEQRVQLERGQQEVSRLKTQLDREQQRVSSLKKELDTEQQRVSTLRVQLDNEHQHENEQTQTIKQLRDQIAHIQETNASLLNGAEGQGSVIRNLQNQVAQAEQQVRHLTDSLKQKSKDVESVTTDLQTANLHIAHLQHAAGETANLQEEHHTLSANLQTAHLQIADLTAQLERATAKIAELQHAGRDVSAKPRSAKAITQPGGIPNVTSIDQARAKHDAGSQGRTKVSHAEVIAFMNAHPTLKRAEVAEKLGISERKVYDAIAWQREQGQEHATSAQ